MEKYRELTRDEVEYYASEELRDSLIRGAADAAKEKGLPVPKIVLVAPVNFLGRMLDGKPLNQWGGRVDKMVMEGGKWRGWCDGPGTIHVNVAQIVVPAEGYHLACHEVSHAAQIAQGAWYPTEALERDAELFARKKCAAVRGAGRCWLCAHPGIPGIH